MRADIKKMFSQNIVRYHKWNNNSESKEDFVFPDAFRISNKSASFPE